MFQSTLVPTTLPGDRLEFVMHGPVSWRADESSQELDAKRQLEFPLPSIVHVIKI